MTANELKNLAAQVRRTETALRNLASVLALNKDDQKALLNAATVLASRGRKLGVEASQAKRVEEAKAKARTKATRDARALMVEWPTVATTLDKVAICLAMRMEGNLRTDLQNDHRLESSLEYWAEQALRDLPEHAAYLAVHESRPVVEVMAAFREKYEQIRARPGTAAFALRWQMGMDARATVLSQGPAQGQETRNPHHG
jgi:hypothetical protein